jgi:excisionase family DNA binding protein
MKPQVERKAFTIREIAARNRIGKDSVYEEVRAGRLRARKLGKRTIVLDTDEEAWRAALPLLELSTA